MTKDIKDMLDDYDKIMGEDNVQAVTEKKSPAKPQKQKVPKTDTKTPEPKKTRPSFNIKEHLSTLFSKIRPSRPSFRLKKLKLSQPEQKEEKPLETKTPTIKEKKHEKHHLPLKKPVNLFERLLHKEQLIFKNYAEKAGLRHLNEQSMQRLIFRISVTICLIISIVSLISSAISHNSVMKLLIFIGLLWTLVFALIFLVGWGLFYLFVDIRVRTILRKNKSYKIEKAVKSKDELKHQKKSVKKKIVKEYFQKAGLTQTDETSLKAKTFKIALILCLAATAFFLVIFGLNNTNVLKVLLFIVILWTFVFVFLLLITWLFIYVVVDLRIFHRRLQVEDVLPDFLQLTSANISAGMTIEKAMWAAVRPRFGMLALEIQEVAKATIAGENLQNALRNFANKFDSKVLKRSINILLEGLEAGGELAELLSKIATDIQETRLLKKEMAANVTTYVIFIGFATIVGAPVLLGLATQLVAIITQIVGGIDMSTLPTSGSLISLNMSGDSISIQSLTIFAIVSLTITSFFSSCIIATIKKGNIKQGIKFIPVFIIVTVLLYFVSNALIGGLLSVFL